MITDQFIYKLTKIVNAYLTRSSQYLLTLSIIIKFKLALNSIFRQRLHSQSIYKDALEIMNFITKSFSKQKKSLEGQDQTLAPISKLNKKTLQTEVLYYTPVQLISQPQGKVFHPCDWSIQEFEIGRHLGKGKYGHVYLARERRSKMLLAIKVLTKKQLINSDIVFQLRRQLQIHSHLEQRNILKMHGFFYDQKKIYIILDYAPYGQLYKILQKETKFNQQKSSKYIYQVIQALKYLHSNNIIHRDIKPQNILLSTDDQIKLTDFGWSVHVGNNKRRKTFCGTPDYICPEIAFRKDYDFRLDLWCLGILTYEFAAGYPPFHDSSERRDLVNRIKQVKFEYPSHFSSELKDFIANLLRLKPEQRMTAQIAEKHPWIRKYNHVQTGNKNKNQIKTASRFNQKQQDIEI